VNVLLAIAGFMGAAGVGLAAASAHVPSAVKLDSAGYLLLIHASAVVAGVAVLERGLLWRPFGWAAVAGFVVGSALFAGDLALRAFADSRLFPMAAPSGGIILIASWLALGMGAGFAPGRP
jgi:uncharacterized membrane protein YgdD (TMEM256/DUF423 family)